MIKHKSLDNYVSIVGDWMNGITVILRQNRKQYLAGTRHKAP